MSASEETAPIPVTVLGGYLGAGKTTIVNAVLREATERIAVLVNDFGDIAIDADLIETSDDDLITLANGCICCSLVDGFAAALDQIREMASSLDRLLIETSGVSDPATVAAYAMTPGFRLDGIVVAADIETIEARADDAYVGQMVRAQLDQADLIVATKADVVDDETAQATIGWLSESFAAPVIATTAGHLSLDALFGLARRAETPRPVPPADDVFTSVTWTGSSLARDELDDMLATLPSEVVRAKGIVRVAGDVDTRVIINIVGSRRSVSDDGPWLDDAAPSSLVVIAVSHNHTAAALDVWLAAQK